MSDLARKAIALDQREFSPPQRQHCVNWASMISPQAHCQIAPLAVPYSRPSRNTRSACAERVIGGDPKLGLALVQRHLSHCPGTVFVAHEGAYSFGFQEVPRVVDLGEVEGAEDALHARAAPCCSRAIIGGGDGNHVLYGDGARFVARR